MTQQGPEGGQQPVPSTGHPPGADAGVDAEASPAGGGADVGTAEVTVEQVIRTRISDALGGWYGSLETALPTVAFVITWLVVEDVRAALLGAAALLTVLAVIRGLVGGSWRFLGSAVFATALAAFFALRSGQAQDAFLPGIITSAVYGVAAVVSILARWPLLGFVVALGDPKFAEQPSAWRRDAGLVRVCSRLTWVLVALFAVRLAVMLPLYLGGEIAWLGVGRVVLGWPAYLLAVVVMGWLLAVGRTPQTADGGQDDVTERMERAHQERTEP